MDVLRLLLISDRPAMLALLQRAAEGGARPLTISHSPYQARGDSRWLSLVRNATVAVVDTAPNPLDAIKMCKQLVVHSPRLPLLAVLCCPTPEMLRHVQGLLAAGARSIIDTCAPLADLHRALHDAARGECVLRAQITRMASLVDDREPPGALPPQCEPSLHLSVDDRRLLGLLTLGRTDRQIGAALCLSEHTVKHRLDHLRSLLQLTNRIELAAWAGQHGFYLPPASDD